MNRKAEYVAMVKDAARAVADERRRHAGTQGYRGHEERTLEGALRMATSAGFGPDARAAVRAILRTAPVVALSPGVKWQRDAQRAKRRASGKAMYPAIRFNPAGWVKVSSSPRPTWKRGAMTIEDKGTGPAAIRSRTASDRFVLFTGHGFGRGYPSLSAAKNAAPRSNPVTAGDDVTKAYPWAKKEAEYQSWQMGPQQLREARDEAMRSRDQADAIARPSQSAAARSETALKAAQKAHAAAQAAADRDYAIYGWHADDVSTIAQERKRRLESAKSASASEIAALSNPRRRNPHDARGRYHGEIKGNGRTAKIHQYTEGGGYHVIFALVHRDGEEQVVNSPQTAYKTLAGAERKARTWVNDSARRNPFTVEVNSDGLPPKAPRGYVRIYTVNGGDMMETPTRRFDNVVDAVAHATRTRRPYVVVEDVSKERARRYGVG